MTIVGDHPDSGIRFVLERGEGPPFAYVGAAFTPDRKFMLRVVVEADGATRIDTNATGAPDDVAETARLLVRTLARHATAEGTTPPRRVVRWRAEK